MDELRYYNTREEYEDEVNSLYLSEPTVAYIESEDKVEYVPHNPINDYFTTTALEDNTVFTCSLQWKDTDSSAYSQLSYSLDNGQTWTTTNTTSSGLSVTTPVVNSGDKILWKGIGKVMGNGQYYTKSNSSTSKFTYFYANVPGGNNSSANHKMYEISGNAMSLLYGDEFRDKFSLPPTISSTTSYPRYVGKTFNFYGKLVSAENLILPATTLRESCYQEMFNGITTLRKAPRLPATTLVQYCYHSMFQNCTSLEEAPDLPATTLADGCYYQMFKGCTSLTDAPDLPATTLIDNCYASMFYNCTSLEEAPDLPSTTLAQSCYAGMFWGCSSLTTAPNLSTTTLAPYCYDSMFRGCTSLTEAPDLPATTLANYCYYYMFYGCTALHEAPELPATTLISRCYYSMFYNCSNLNYIKMLATDISASYCLNNWVQGVAATGTFVKSADASWDVTGASGIPSGWEVETYPQVGK